ncbi:MAG: MFS transporter [Enterobacter asburiae]|nr:MFS transporter [Enterobacter asburiae]
MPLVIYVFTISAFALGLAEFVPIGLTDVMANGLGVNIEQAGSAVTTYALGATFAAPVLTALTANWSRKNVMLITALIFTVGSLISALAASLTTLLIARFVAGMGHGLFLAVASSTAARLAGPEKAGRAIAVVFGGLTLAMAIGVPLSTWIGGVISWRPALGIIALAGAIGFFGLLFGMKNPLSAPLNQHRESALENLSQLLNRKLLAGAFVTVLAYAGSFTAYTFIAPILTEVTGLSSHAVSLYMLIYGVMAAVGNILGGRLTDAFGVNRANLTIITGITFAVFGMWIFAISPVGMAILVALLGMLTFGAVPALQARLFAVAERHAPHAHGIASGLNIAGFNSGIALGSVLGSLTLSTVGIAWTGFTAGVVALLGLALFSLQINRARTIKFNPSADAGR